MAKRGYQESCLPLIDTIGWFVDEAVSPPNLRTYSTGVLRLNQAHIMVCHNYGTSISGGANYRRI